jgi:hypothetical protein
MAKRGFVALPPGGRFSILHAEDLCRLILAVLGEPDTYAETYEPDDGREGGWEHRHFARTLGRLYGRRAATVAMPRTLMRAAARVDRLFRRSRAKLTADRVSYYCHPDWVSRRSAGPLPPLDPESKDSDRPQGDGDWYKAQGWLK